MRILELFSGTGSIGNTFAEQGWEVISLDSDVKTDATIHEDILTWDYTVYPPGHFDMIWASPCCTQYSCARRNAKTPRNLSLADSLVLRSREIINYYNPRVWFLENPQTGMLKDRPFMQDLPYTDIDYCCYCDWGYRKKTRLWNNIGFEGNQCKGRGACPNMDGNKHKSTAQQGKNKSKEGMYGNTFSINNLHRVPPALCRAIEIACKNTIFP